MDISYKYTPKSISFDLLRLCNKRLYDLEESMKIVVEIRRLILDMADHFDSEESFIFQANDDPTNQLVYQFLDVVSKSNHSMRFTELLELIMTTDFKNTLDTAEELRPALIAYDVILQEYWRRREAEEAEKALIKVNKAYAQSVK